MRKRKRPKKASKPSEEIELALDRKQPIVTKGTGVLRGTVRYPWGAVKQVRVSVGESSVFSDDSGQYEIKELAAGSHVINVQLPFPGYAAQPQTVELAEGETKVVDVNFDFKKTIVEGYVYDEKEKKEHPILNAVVSGVFCGKDTEQIVTDEKGHFRFDRASPGNQFIRVNAPGYVAQTKEFRAVEGEPTSLEFHLVQGSCRIHGFVKEGGQPLHANVTLSSAIGVRLEMTTSDLKTGQYEFRVAPGKYNLLAAESEHESKGWRGAVSDETRVDFELAKSRSLRLDRIPQDLGEGTYDDQLPW